MSNKTWKGSAMAIGEIISLAAEKYPELKPLQTSWSNFARKNGIRRPRGNNVHRIKHLEETLRLQSEEIEALEFRIKALER